MGEQRTADIKITVTVKFDDNGTDVLEDQAKDALNQQWSEIPFHEVEIDRIIVEVEPFESYR